MSTEHQSEAPEEVIPPRNEAEESYPPDAEEADRVKPVKTVDGRFVIVGRTVNDKQEHFYEVTTVEGARDPSVSRFFVTVGKNTPNAGALNRHLEEVFSGRGEQRPLRMTTAPTANQSLHMLVSCEPELTRMERAIFNDKGEKLGEYTEEVAKAVETSLDCEIEAASLRFLAEIEAEGHLEPTREAEGKPSLRGAIKESAARIMVQTSERLGLNVTPAEAATLLKPGPLTLEEIVRGDQDGPGSHHGQVRYSLSHVFETQIAEGLITSDRKAAVSALRNFALQQATVAAFSARCEHLGSTDKESPCIAELHEASLMQAGHLAGRHPRKSPEDHRDVSGTRAFLIGATTLQGLMASMGANPADVTKDEIAYRIASDARSGKKDYLHTKVEPQVEAINHKDSASRMRSYIEFAHDQALKNLNNANRLVRHEQDKTRPKPAKKPDGQRHPVAALVEGLVTRTLPDLVKGTVGALDDGPRLFG